MKKIAATPSTVNDYPLAVQEFYYKNQDNIDDAIGNLYKEYVESYTTAIVKMKSQKSFENHKN